MCQHNPEDTCKHKEKPDGEPCECRPEQVHECHGDATEHHCCNMKTHSSTEEGD